jgi:hypothetical protein
MKDKDDIHPQLWSQLSPTQQYNYLVKVGLSIHTKDDLYIAARANIMTSPPCITMEEARGYDAVSMSKLESEAKQYELTPIRNYNERP